MHHLLVTCCHCSMSPLPTGRTSVSSPRYNITAPPIKGLQAGTFFTFRTFFSQKLKPPSLPHNLSGELPPHHTTNHHFSVR
jgi:hypothetical protein